MDLIIFHNKCPDGFCSAFIAKKRYPEAEILAMDHGEPVPFDAVRGKDVLVLDFSWPVREDNIKLHNLAKSFHIYDHHRTAEERLAGLPFVTFDMKRSGASLAWDYLFGGDSYEPELRIPRPRPWYVNYVEDRDLWNWALPESKEINAYLMSLPMTIEAWSTLDNSSPRRAAELGRPVVSHIDRYVREIVEEAQFGTLHLDVAPGQYIHRTAAVVNCPYMNCSEVGNVLAKKAEVSITWFERADGLTQFSLRSIGDVDVSEIAKAFLGGGHKNAAGFRLPLEDGRKLIDHTLGRNSNNG
jgi:uncharacterized protein